MAKPGKSSGKSDGSKLRNMSAEQKEDFLAAYNLSGSEFKSTHNLNQAYDAALKRYREYGGSRTGDYAAVKGMEFIQLDNSSKLFANRTARLEKLKNDYFKMISGKKGAKDEKASINLMGLGRANIEQRIKRFKEKGHL